MASLQPRVLTLIMQTIASGDADSMESFSHHTIAAAHCIQLRGPIQFRSEAAVKLFLQMRRIIVSVITPLSLRSLHRFSHRKGHDMPSIARADPLCARKVVALGGVHAVSRRVTSQPIF